MPLLRIPEQHYAGLELILSLSDESANKLIAVLEKAPPKLFPSDLVSEIISKIPSIEPDDLEGIIDTLHTLYLIKLHNELASEELAEDVCVAMEESEEEDLQLSPETRQPFKDRLTQLLSLESLTVLAKALSVLRNQENMYCRAQIITDIRPVFGSNPEASPTAAVLVHMLNVTYHHRGKLKDFYIALDTDSIQALREVLDRADMKVKSLRSLLSDSKIAYLDLE